MARKKRVLDIQLRLNGEVKTRFLEVKRAEGLTDDEVLRLIIDEYFEKNLRSVGAE